MARRKRQIKPRWGWRKLLVAAIALVTIASVAGNLQPGKIWDWLSDSFPDQSERSIAWVSTDVLNVRGGPSIESAILSTGTYGDEVIVTGGPDHQFLPVEIDGVQGWMAEAHLSSNDVDRTLTQVTGVLPQEVSAAESADEPAPPERIKEDPTVAPQRGERWIEVDRSSATVTLHDGEVVEAVFPGRMGRDPSADGFYSTAVGTYTVYSMNKGLSPTPFADDTYLTDWVGFDPVRKNGIHSPVRDAEGVEKPWQNQTTLGCVRLGAEAAETVFAFAEIGMRVEVRD